MGDEHYTVAVVSFLFVSFFMLGVFLVHAFSMCPVRSV